MARGCAGLGAAVTVGLLLFTLPASAQQDKDWTGEVSENWSEEGNWDPEGVPASADDVFIDTLAPNNQGTVVEDSAVANAIWVGLSDQGSLTIQGGGELTGAVVAVIGSQGSSTGTVTVMGSAASWTQGFAVTVGLSGSGNLLIEAGATVSLGGVFIGNLENSQGTVRVDGSGSLLDVSGTAPIGVEGTGTLVIEDGGTVTASAMLIAQQAGSDGNLSIGPLPAEGTGASGILDASGVTFGEGSGTLTFNHTDPDHEFAPSLSGPDAGGSALVRVLAGTTRMTGDSTDFAGTTQIERGTLNVAGALGGTLEVQPDGRLEGAGTVGETTNDGTVAAGESIGTLSVDGAYTHAAGATLEVEIEPGGTADLLAVNGAADLQGGTVSVLLAPGDYEPGTEIPILTADGGLTGEFDTLESDNPDVAVELVHEPENNRVLLVVSQQQEEGADLALGKTATVNEGATVVFTLEVTNNGPEDATEVVVVDTLPACVELTNDDCGGTESDGDWTWTIDQLATGETVSCELTADASGCAGEGEQANTAEVSSAAQDDPNPDNDTAEAVFDLEVVPALPRLAFVLLLALLLLTALRTLRRSNA